MSALTLFQSHLPNESVLNQVTNNDFGFLKALATDSGCTFAHASLSNNNMYCFIIVLSNLNEQVQLNSKLLEVSHVVMDENPTYSFTGYQIEIISEVCTSSSESTTSLSENGSVDAASQQLEGMELNDPFLKLVLTWPPYLPKLKDTHRCLGVTRSGTQCGHERFRGWCYSHKEQGVKFMDMINKYAPFSYDLPIWQSDTIKASLIFYKLVYKLYCIIEVSNKKMK
jgi:hypothetical protein